MTNGLNLLVVADELEACARKIKDYIDNQSVDVSDFQGAQTSAGGTSGLVPAPPAGDSTRFLCADSQWKPFLIGSSPSTVEGAMWLVKV